MNRNMRQRHHTQQVLDAVFQINCSKTRLVWFVVIGIIGVSQDLVLDTLALGVSFRQGAQPCERENLLCFTFRWCIAGLHPYFRTTLPSPVDSQGGGRASQCRAWLVTCWTPGGGY